MILKAASTQSFLRPEYKTSMHADPDDPSGIAAALSAASLSEVADTQPLTEEALKAKRLEDTRQAKIGITTPAASDATWGSRRTTGARRQAFAH